MAAEYKSRINKLQKRMEKEKIDFYLVLDADCHNSEYTPVYYQLRSALCGFTGSNGTLLISKDSAWLWTDGRYFIQAMKELEGSGVSLMRTGEPNVPSIKDFLANQMQSNMTLGFCGCTVSKVQMDGIREALLDKKKDCFFSWEKDTAREVICECAQNPKLYEKLDSHSVYPLPFAFCGESVEDKIEAIRKNLSDNGCDSFFCSKLDTIMWLFNVRGSDIAFNPVAYAYAYISAKEAILFIHEKVMDDTIKEYASTHHFLLSSYENIVEFLTKRVKKSKIATLKEELSFSRYYFFLKMGATIISSDCRTETRKAMKNEIEQEMMRRVYLEDSIAVCRFLKWFQSTPKELLTEADCARKMDALRKEIDGFVDLSFSTISAYGENAAMMHYEAAEGRCAKLKNEGMYLIDSGGQYFGGTTDVTRTIHAGTVTPKMKECFTATVKGMLHLQNAVFLHGCCGVNLDILAREPIWELNRDYKCGTGHGVGCMLGVHEGPQSIRTRIKAEGESIFEEGMVVSDEPGVYIEGEFGIRMENILLCKKQVSNEDGTFMCFEPLTLVPIDKDLIEEKNMTDKELKWLEEYQNLVYKKLSPHLDEETKVWLYEQTH